MTLNDELHNTTLTEAVRQIDNLVQRAELEGNPLAATAFRFLKQYASKFEKINDAGLELICQVKNLNITSAARKRIKPHIEALDNALTYIDEPIIP